MGFFDFLTGSNIGKASMNALNNNSQILTNLQNAGNNIINTGEQQSSGALNQASNNYNPYLATGSAATTMYGNALGLNGADGTQAAQNAFQAGPGYQFALDQGTQAALRGSSAAGMLNSGNTLTELQKYGTGLANQEYNNWLSNLSGASGQGLSAASGQGGALSGLANLYQGTANDRLGLESAIAQGRQGINTDAAKVKEQQAQNSNSFFSNLLGGGLSLGAKALTGGLF
jgi:hypothetical protein